MNAAPEPYGYDTENPLVYGNEMGRYKTRRQLEFIIDQLPPGRARILDIGGGAGRLAIPLAELGHELTVMDLSAEALELLRSRAGSAVATVHCDLSSFSSADAFDVALVIDTLKYMSTMSLSEIFLKLNSLLSPGGMLCVAEINRGSWRNRISELVGRRRGQAYNIATVDEYRAALADAHFSTTRVFGYLWMPLVFNSDSRLVRLFARAEAAMRLGCWARQSPWLLIAAQKPGRSGGA